MEELLQHVEQRIHKLMVEYKQLIIMNDQLKRQQLHITHEKEQLLVKQQTVVTQIENMVSRLKSIEGLL